MRLTAKWHESPEEVVEEDYLLVEKTGRRSGGVVPGTKSLPWIGQTFCARCKNRCGKRPHPRSRDAAALETLTRYTNKHPRMSCRYPLAEWDNNGEVFGGRKIRWVFIEEKSTVGGVAMWSGQLAKAWSKTVGVLALPRRIRAGWASGSGKHHG